MSIELTMSNTAGVASILALWSYAAGAILTRWQKVFVRLGLAILFLSFASISVAIATRGLEAARFPIANLYESLLLFAWGILAAFLALNRTYRIGHLGWVTALVVSSVFLYTSWLPATQKEIAPLMPALVSGWRTVHVPPLMVSYGLLVIAGVSAVGELFALRRWRTATSCLAAIGVTLFAAVAGTRGLFPQGTVQLLFWGGSLVCLVSLTLSLRFELKLPKGDDEADQKGILYEEITQRCISVAFPLLTFGIITGALWANHAWGSYWSWDPKESMSLATWLSYASYLHLRAHKHYRSEVMAVIAVVGLLVTLLTYLGFNFLGFGGLHSYGKIS